MAACTSAAAASASWRETKTRSPEKNIGKDGANPYQALSMGKIYENWGKYGSLNGKFDYV